jgi:hypothetical protein
MPVVEILEERMLMNNRFVVPAVAADNLTRFSSLDGALTMPGLNTGDIIQIEPGSSPGQLVNSDLPFVQNLTIQGDPAYDVQSIPWFSIGSPVYIGFGEQGLAFKNAEINIQQGILEFTADGTISGCRIRNEYAGFPIALVDTSAATITNSYIENDAPNQSKSLVTVEPATGSHNLITDNQFVSINGSPIVLLNYSGGAGTTDLVAHNSFVSDSSSSLFLVRNDTQGLTLQGNSFTDSDSTGTAIEVDPTVQNLRIVDNTISVPNGGFFSDGILVDAGLPTGTSSMVIANNHIHTGGDGSGIEFTGEASTYTFVAKVEGNDLTGNGTGVLIDAGQGGSVAGIDLGGGAQGSLGGNDFRGDYSNSWFSVKDAIVVRATWPAGPTIQAQGNIFGVADPSTVIQDHNQDPTVAAVVSAGQMTGNAAYVETLYLDFLHRTGNLGNPNDAGGWVTLLNQGMPATTVANDIVRSAEALGIAINGLYHRFLGRDADPAGRAYFVNYLQTGGTLEGISRAILGSKEYRSHFPTDSSFVQSLYQNLLHRTGSSAEIAGWLAQLPQLGRTGVAQAFLSSLEYREREVSDDYMQILHRVQPPPAIELSNWAGTSLDLLTIDMLFAGSPEFQVNG